MHVYVCTCEFICANTSIHVYVEVKYSLQGHSSRVTHLVFVDSFSH